MSTYTFSDAAGDWIAVHTAIWSPGHYASMRRYSDRLANVIGSKPLTLISRRDVSQALDALGDTDHQWNIHRHVARTVFGYAVEHGHLDHSPMDKLRKRKIAKLPDIRVLTLDQSRALMAACEDAPEPWMQHYAALALFSGCRPLEILRLDWSQIDLRLKHIDLRLVGRKRGSRRIIPIARNLAEWLGAGGVGAVVPVSSDKFKQAWARVRITAGVRDTWQNDICRHSFVSYHLAMHRDMARTIMEARHRDATMIEQHYLHGVPRKDAQAYWRIRPRSRFATAMLCIGRWWRSITPPPPPLPAPESVSKPRKGWRPKSGRLWRITSPDGAVHETACILSFIRENEALFAAEDVAWKPLKKGQTCPAAGGLYQAARALQRWKGWRCEKIDMGPELTDD